MKRKLSAMRSGCVRKRASRPSVPCWKRTCTMPSRMPTISVTFSFLWSIGAMRSITANALDFGYAGRNISCVRNAEILISRKNVSSRPFWAIWGKLKPEGNLPSRRSQSRSHTAHIQSTQDSLRCTFITAICSVGSKNGSTRRACRRTCEKRS